MKAIVIIPAYQAHQSIGPLVADVRRVGLPVIVVDDASDDGTAAAAEAEGATVIRRAVNGGKGAALRDGFGAALQTECEWVLTLDADGQHLVSEIPLFIKEADRGRADLLIGNRMGKPRGMPLDRWVTNLIMSRIISKAAGQKVPDTQCGFRMVHRRVLEKVRLTSDRFEVETELVIRAARAGFRIASVPISSVYRRQISFIRPLRDTARFFALLRRLKAESPQRG